MFKKILVPVDGSETAQKAVRVGVEIAEKFGGEITLLHVIGRYLAELVMGPPEAMTMVTESVVAEWEKAGRQILQEASALLQPHAVAVTTDLAWGNPARIISQKVKDEGFELIVMGGTGRERLGELLLGSVTDRVSRSAACPVLIVKL
jgi:nucleotide-binding universal stress UspA family protein